MSDDSLETRALDAWLEAFPKPPGMPFMLRPDGAGFAGGLYTVAALYAGFDPARPESWARTYDHAAYVWFIDTASGKPRRLTDAEAVAARLHDAAIEAAIDRYLRALPAKVVGFMGGHANRRADPEYRRTAVMARSVRRKGLQVVTGGGPGLMEAANLGAFLAPYDDDALDDGLAWLRRYEFADDVGGWLKSACEVRGRLLGGDWTGEPRPESRNLGIPTWCYGNEPPNVFATAIGKYFYNSVREDGLISVASGGLVFGPGEAGTVQEVFQDVTLNYYRPAGVRPTPMVFVGKAFWDPEQPSAAGPLSKPVYPLVRAMGEDRNFADALLISDDVDEMVRFLEAADLATPAPQTLAARRLSRSQ